MKTQKLIVACLIGAALSCSLSGCRQQWDTYRRANSENMSDTENAFIIALDKANADSTSDDIAEVYAPLFNRYLEKGDNSNFFCGNLYALSASEVSVQNKSDYKQFVFLSALIQNSTGQSISDLCKQEKGLEAPKEIKIKEQKPVNDYKVPDEETTYQLSSQLYDDLILAIHECKRSEYQTMQSFSQDDKLTKEQYNNVVKIVMDCKRYRLERALQGDDHAKQ